MRDTIELAREAGMTVVDDEYSLLPFLKRFAELVRADEREIVMNEPLTKAQWQRFEDEIRADEREACAQACDKTYYQNIGPEFGEVRHGIAACAAAIRARSNT